MREILELTRFSETSHLEECIKGYNPNEGFGEDKEDFRTSFDFDNEMVAFATYDENDVSEYIILARENDSNIFKDVSTNVFYQYDQGDIFWYNGKDFQELNSISGSLYILEDNFDEIMESYSSKREEYYSDF